MSTTTLSATNLRNNLSDALDSVVDDTVLVITRRGLGEKAIVDINMLEDLLAASRPDYLAQIKAARASKELFTHENVFGDID